MTKRIFDLVLTIPVLTVLLLPLGFLATIVAIVLGRPVLFRQQRLGLHGKPFSMLKFRTMTDTRDDSGALLSDADRLTSFGRFLRATSLDELPELLRAYP